MHIKTNITAEFYFPDVMLKSWFCWTAWWRLSLIIDCLYKLETPECVLLWYEPAAPDVCYETWLVSEIICIRWKMVWHVFFMFIIVLVYDVWNLSDTWPTTIYSNRVLLIVKVTVQQFIWNWGRRGQGYNVGYAYGCTCIFISLMVFWSCPLLLSS